MPDQRHRADLFPRRRAPRAARPPQSGESNFGERFGFGITSMILAVPLSAIAVVQAELPGLIVAWAGIVGVNALHAARGWPWLRREQREKSDWEE